MAVPECSTWNIDKVQGQSQALPHCKTPTQTRDVLHVIFSQAYIFSQPSSPKEVLPFPGWLSGLGKACSPGREHADFCFPFSTKPFRILSVAR